jgi:hypothetical protein
MLPFAEVAVWLAMAAPIPAAPIPAAPVPAERANAASAEAVSADAVHFDWTKYGNGLRGHFPKTANGHFAKTALKAAPQAAKRKAGSLQPLDLKPPDLGQLHYLAEQTADKLCFLGIAPNYDQPGRERAQRKFNDASIGTCGYTAHCLQRVWCGAGLPEKSCKTLVVLKRQPNGQVPVEINADHAALVYLHPDGPLVFDLWCDGRTQNTFANFRTSVWKGMPAGEWARRMLLEGYTVAGVQEHSELGETSPLQLTQLLQKLQAMPAQAGR